MVILLFVADQPLPDSHEHNEQSDRSDSEFAGNRPEEYEESDACEGVSDTLRALIRRFAFPDESFRQRLSGCKCLFGKAITCLPVLVAEEEDYKYDEYRHSENGNDADNGYQNASSDCISEIIEREVVIVRNDGDTCFSVRSARGARFACTYMGGIGVFVIHADHCHGSVAGICFASLSLVTVTFTFPVESLITVVCFWAFAREKWSSGPVKQLQFVSYDYFLFVSLSVRRSSYVRKLQRDEIF